MFLVNGQKAILRQFNRCSNANPFDDQNYRDIPIKVCPYNVDVTIKFGIYTHPEATGFYQVPRYVDIQQGDQIILYGRNRPDDVSFEKETHTVIEVKDSWLFNRVENKSVIVK
jgi:hypothetical protein|nr:MAG TPA_asm: hypothetical protein [Caudoviricetes sp.]